jgi:hypothetical protein
MQRTRVEAKVPASQLSWRVKFGPLEALQVEELSSILQSLHAVGKGGENAKTDNLALSSSLTLETQTGQKRNEKRRGDSPGVTSYPSNSKSLPPETIVLDLLICRLEKETAALKIERRSMSGNKGTAPKAWPIRYGALEDKKTAAVAAGEYLAAAALQQQIAHLKSMLAAVAAHHQTVDQITQRQNRSEEAIERALHQAIGQEDYLSAALLTSTHGKMQHIDSRGGTTHADAANDVARIRSLVEGELSLAPEVTEELIKNGIATVNALRTATKEQLTVMTKLKRGPRVKLLKLIEDGIPAE